MEVARVEASDSVETTETDRPVLHFTGSVKEAEPMDESTSASSVWTEPIDKFFDRCKNMEFDVGFECPEHLKNKIPGEDVLRTYFPTESFRKSLLNVYFRIKKIQERMQKPELSSNEVIGKPINQKFIGKPGTGKSAMITAMAACLRLPLGIIPCQKNMEEDGIEGLNKYINGQIWSVPTECGQIFDKGGIILLEEFNLPDPAVLQGALGQALEAPYIFNLYGVQQMKRHPLTIFIGTMNENETNGTRDLNQAFSSRFPESVYLDNSPDEEFINILAKAGYKKMHCRNVFKKYKQILNYLSQYNEDLVQNITMRHCYAALEDMDIGMSLEDACDRTFIGELKSIDRQTAEDIRSVLFK